MGIDTSYANYLKNLAVVPYAANNVELKMIHTGLVCWARTQSHKTNGYMTSRNVATALDMPDTIKMPKTFVRI